MKHEMKIISQVVHNKANRNITPIKAIEELV